MARETGAEPGPALTGLARIRSVAMVRVLTGAGSATVDEPAGIDPVVIPLIRREHV